MDSFTLEIVSDPGDPLDRSLGILCKVDRTLVACRSIRISRETAIGVVLLWLDRLLLCWGQPQLNTPVDLHEMLDACERAIGDPF